MAEFRLTQISDPHLTRRHASLTANFEHVSAHIDATRPDLVINSGDRCRKRKSNHDGTHRCILQESSP